MMVMMIGFKKPKKSTLTARLRKKTKKNREAEIHGLHLGIVIKRQDSNLNLKSFLMKKMEKKGIKADTKADDAKYTMIVKTTRLEPGFNIGITRQNAEIDVEISFVETSNPSNVLCKITVKKSPGQIYGGYGFRYGNKNCRSPMQNVEKCWGAFLVKKFPK